MRSVRRDAWWFWWGITIGGCELRRSCVPRSSGGVGASWRSGGEDSGPKSVPQGRQWNDPWRMPASLPPPRARAGFTMDGGR